jgi:hypothetical protein
MNQLTNNLLAQNYTISGPGIQVTSNAGAVDQLETIISTAIGVLTIVGVIYFVIQIILAGYTLISSKGDPKQFQLATSKLIYSLIGLLIVTAALGATAFISGLMGINNIFNLTTSLPKLTP